MIGKWLANRLRKRIVGRVAETFGSCYNRENQKELRRGKRGKAAKIIE